MVPRVLATLVGLAATACALPPAPAQERKVAVVQGESRFLVRRWDDYAVVEPDPLSPGPPRELDLLAAAVEATGCQVRNSAFIDRLMLAAELECPASPRPAARQSAETVGVSPPTVTVVGPPAKAVDVSPPVAAVASPSTRAVDVSPPAATVATPPARAVDVSPPVATVASRPVVTVDVSPPAEVACVAETADRFAVEMAEIESLLSQAWRQPGGGPAFIQR